MTLKGQHECRQRSYSNIFSLAPTPFELKNITIVRNLEKIVLLIQTFLFLLTHTSTHTHTHTHDIIASFVIATLPPPSVPCCLCCIFISLKTIFPRDRKLSPRKINLLRITRLVHRYEIKYRDRELKRFVFKNFFLYLLAEYQTEFRNISVSSGKQNEENGESQKISTKHAISSGERMMTIDLFPPKNIKISSFDTVYGYVAV